VDGNAIGGMLQEIFRTEMTTSMTTCDGCGAVSVMGRVDVYMNGPGVVVRCPGCGQVLLRLVRGPGRLWIDLRGTRCLELKTTGA